MSKSRYIFKVISLPALGSAPKICKIDVPVASLFLVPSAWNKIIQIEVYKG